MLESSLTIMPRKSQRRLQGEINEEMDSNERSLSAQATKALLSSVEEESRRSSSEKGRDDDDDGQVSVRSHEAFLELFEPSSNPENNEFLRRGISNKDQRTILLKSIEQLSKPYAVRFFLGVRTIANEIVSNEVYFPESAPHDDEDVDWENVASDESSSQALLFLRMAALCAQTYVEQYAATNKSRRESAVSKHLDVLPEVFELVVVLHGILFDLNKCGPDGKIAQHSISKVCEMYWNVDGKHREHVMTQTLPLIVSSALADTAPKAELVRLYKMRHAVEAFDFSDSTSDWLRLSLMKVASSPRCLKVPEGRRFSAYLLQADTLLTPSMHEAMKAQIPDSKKTMQEYYSEIYFRAWMEADDEEGEMRNQLENDVLSDLVYTLLHIAKPSMYQALLTIMSSFHENKRTPEVEDLINRLYGPILWRSLKAANAKVRANATYVLAEVFPLDQSSHTQTSKQIEKACAALQELLEDEDTQVRMAASFAVSKVLSGYWDVLPATAIRTLLNEVVARHASDSSSPAVRASALDTITTLLNVQQSHAVLKRLLPKLGNLIHDKIERVRLAAVRLLDQVKRTPAVKYYDIVPVPDLEAHLAEERSRGPVVSALSALMLNSYVPQGDGVTPSQQLNRIVRFLKKDQEAAISFFGSLHPRCPVESVAKIAVLLFKLLHDVISGKSAASLSSKKDKVLRIKVGTKVRKEFSTGWFNGEVVAIEGGFFSVTYSDGDQEDLDQQEVIEAATSFMKHNSKGKRKRAQVPKDDDENNENLTNSIPQNDQKQAKNTLSRDHTSLVSGIAQSICALLHSIEEALKKRTNQEWKELLLNTFSEESIFVDIIRYTDDYKSRSNEDSTMEDCSITRAAMLRCAAWVGHENLDDLSNYISTAFQNVNDQPQDLALQCSVPSYVALFCHWGKEEDMVESLAKSIAGFLDDQISVGLFDPPLSESTKRRRKANVAGNEAAVSVPLLPPKLALDSLSAILQDTSPMYFDARSKILLREKSCEAMKNVLEKALSHFSDLLLKDSFTSHHLGDENLLFALRCIELYGKFLLHVQGSCLEKRRFSVDPLLHFVTKTLVESFLASNAAQSTGFQDPDISGISMIMPSPLAETVSEHARRRTRGSTLTGRGSILRDDVEGSRVLRGVTESLFFWICSFLVDWIELTEMDGHLVLEESTKWCQIFTKYQEFTKGEVILRGFLRLSFQLWAKNRQFDLLRGLITAFADNVEAEEIFVDAFSTFLTFDSEIGNELLQFVVVQSAELEPFEANLPDSIENLWPQEGSLRACLKSLSENELSRAEGIRSILLRLRSEGTAEKEAVFLLRLVHYLHAVRPTEQTKSLLQSMPNDFSESNISQLAAQVLESME